ncbi:MAG: hypothetical protein ABIM54_00910 [candidate division WOR-3 bacterium]
MSNYLNELSKKLKEYKELKEKLSLELEGLTSADWGEDNGLREETIKEKKLLLEAVEERIRGIEDVFEEEKLNEAYEEYKVR